MSRLLHAAARGARIQTNDRGGWLDAAYIPTADYKGDDFRIHPDDEHLQYGPISTALRDASENVQPRMMYTISNFILVGAVCDYTEVVERNDGWNSALNIHRSLFLLFLAEALADSGL